VFLLSPSSWAGPADTPRQAAGTGSVWLAEDGRTTVVGRGRRLAIHDRHAGTHAEVLLEAPSSSGALLGGSLMILGDDGRLSRIDLDAPQDAPRRVGSRPAAGRWALMAAMGSDLVVADRSRGVALLAMPALPHRGACDDSPEQAAIEAAPAGFLAIDETIVSMAAEPGRLAAALGDGTIVVFEKEHGAADPLPEMRRTIPLGAPARAVALASGRLYALVASGLVRVDLDSDDPSSHAVASIEGVALAVVGREVSVLPEEGAPVRIIDREASALLFTVSVQNNFFSPGTLTILPGDTVRWSNASGFHNVFSCTTTQDGCSADAEESFNSGNPGTLWILNHTFTEAGENPYICQPHAPFMTGMINVAGHTAPPPVADGRDGAPMTAANGPGGMTISWDDECGAAPSYHLIWGHRGQLPAAPGGTFTPGGSICGIASPYLWSASPDPAGFPGRILWWLILPGETATEGSWGIDSTGTERKGPGTGGASGVCGFQSKDVSATCNP